jgi:hypothetical protein
MKNFLVVTVSLAMFFVCYLIGAEVTPISAFLLIYCNYLFVSIAK